MSKHTEQSLAERLAGCRDNARAFRKLPDRTRFTYRLINANLYQQYKARLASLKALKT